MRLPCKCRSWTSNLPSLALSAARHRNPDLTWGAAARAVLFASVAAACLRAMVFSLSSSYRVFSVRSLPSPLHTLVAVGGTYPPIKQTLNLLSDLKGKQRRRSPQPARARAGNSSFSKIFDGRHGPGGDGGASKHYLPVGARVSDRLAERSARSRRRACAPSEDTVGFAHETLECMP